jgi:hypothetical protein
MPGFEPGDDDSDSEDDDSSDDDQVEAHVLNPAPRVHRNGDELQTSPPAPLDDDDEGEMEGRGEAAPRELMGYIMIGNLDGLAPNRQCPVGVGNAADIPAILNESGISSR